MSRWERLVAYRQLHPINCVDWNQASQYARFKGARLPSESEWEYAAKSAGKNQKYPWGNPAMPSSPTSAAPASGSALRGLVNGVRS